VHLGRETVEHRDLVVPGAQLERQVRADEPGAACYQYPAHGAFAEPSGARAGRVDQPHRLLDVAAR
jgi:hypothetical protein